MVLQVGDRRPLWGWADPNEEVAVRVSWRDSKWCIQADETGKWQFKLAPPGLGGPYEMTLKGKNTVTLKNVLVGEVWVCSGQSNMQMAVRQRQRRRGGDRRRRTTRRSACSSVERTVAETPQDDCKGNWAGLHARDRAATSPPSATSSAASCTRSSTCPSA